MELSPPTSSTPGLRRRSLVKGVAWTVPVVTFASAAPAYAASGHAGPTFTVGTVCTIHGERCAPFDAGYIFSLHVSNLSGVDARITQISVNSNDNPSLILFIANPTIPTTILSGYVQNWYLNVTSNGQVPPPFNASINISWRPDVTPTATPTLVQLPVHVSAVSECRSCTPDGSVNPDQNRPPTGS